MNKLKSIEIDWRIGLSQAILTGIGVGLIAAAYSYADYRNGIKLGLVKMMDNFGDVIMDSVKEK